MPIDAEGKKREKILVYPGSTFVQESTTKYPTPWDTFLARPALLLGMGHFEFYYHTSRLLVVGGR